MTLIQSDIQSHSTKFLGLGVGYWWYRNRSDVVGKRAGDVRKAVGVDIRWMRKSENSP